MAVTDGKCRCSGGKSDESCPACGVKEQPAYWCDTCRQAVAWKRCPLCGLKARKMRKGENGG